ncbi:unnamed protein product [Clonostachys byssicola]|uniref:MHYT domain-containing protein n=1 Tax=Clonostachys byssicola TaxID=160290 RepID=A0A9N9XXH7_9HYPO|nr:unnamed protein product [Clonostachys byssicola]
MSPDELLHKYEGQMVHQQFNAGFVVLSYIVSLIGAGSTLELINRRTGFKGLFNNVILASAAVTMGGVSIWSMHFVGNRAIVLGDNEPEIQIAYSTLFTVISFFVPILVLLLTFIAIGNSISWVRISLGGFLCGSAVCGMHYLGNASIENYTCTYKIGYVIGAVLIALTASTVALSIFFIFRSMWANAWWKRLLSALLLAGAVSGMHWCAALGTEYTLVSIQEGAGDHVQNSTIIIIVIICLAIAACLTIAGLVIYTTRKMNQSAQKAQKISLGAAVFDKEGRILVDSDGLLPSTTITDSFIQVEDQQPFTIAHPYFLWMFQATRNLSGLSGLINGMKRHIAQNTHKQTEKSPATDDQGLLIRGQFCLASVRLADRLRQDYSSAGVLWDEILVTGTARRSTDSSRANLQNLYEKYATLHLQSGQGSLMFLVHHVQNEREYTQLTMAGYRFAEIDHVSDIIASNMQIKSMGFRAKLRQMAQYADIQERTTGVQMGFFGIRPNTSGFDVYVKRLGRYSLPSVSLPLPKLESWHLATLQEFHGMTVAAISEILEDINMPTERETEFLELFRTGLKSLQQLLRDPLFEDAVLVPGVVDLPKRGSSGFSSSSTMLTFRIVASAQSVASNTDYEYIPLSLFNVYQLIKTPEGQLSFIHGVDTEFGSIIKSQRSGDKYEGDDKYSQTRKQSCVSAWDEEEGIEGKSIGRPSTLSSTRSGSTADLYHSPRLGSRHSKKQHANVRELDAPVEESSDIELRSQDHERVATFNPSEGHGGYDTYIDQLLRGALEGSEWKT